MKKDFCQCGNPKQKYSKECRRCYVIGRVESSWELVQLKECKNCTNLVPKIKGSYASSYKKRKFCSISCASSFRLAQWRRKGWQSPGIYRAKIKRPAQEDLLRLFSEVRSYKVMAERLGVVRNTILNWLGPKNKLMNPRYD